MKKTGSEKRTRSLPAEILATLAGYAKTQFLLSVTVAILVWITLTVLGIKYAVFLAVVAGSLSVVPVFGMTIAAVIAGIVAAFDGVRFFTGWHQALDGIAVFLLLLLINQFTDFILAPYLMGKTSGISPLIILTAVITGTFLFGIPGTILAVPVLLIIRAVIKYQRN